MLYALILAASVGTINFSGAVVVPSNQGAATITQTQATQADPHYAPFLTYYGVDGAVIKTVTYQ